MYREIPYIEVHAVDHCNHNCRWCHNYSPFSPQREYAAQEYIPWLDLLWDKQVPVRLISVMGGEPMLHSDIENFCAALLERYRTPLLMTTNGFWLSEDAILAYGGLWNMLSRIKISHYPTIMRRLGGEKRVEELLNLLRARHPHLSVESPIKYAFSRLSFHVEPREVTHPCFNAGCTALLSTGIMGRCGAGAYMHFAPDGLLTELFRQSRHMLYDLRRYDWTTFWMWFNRFPMDACEHCSFGQSSPLVQWKVEKGRRPFNTDYEAAFAVKTAIMHLRHGHAAQAQQCLEAAAASGHQAKEVANARGLLHYRAGRLHAARDCFRQALDLDPAYLDAARNLSHTMRRDALNPQAH
ncbi:MAG: radical SAM protein [Desulfovibrionaceae bacterium]